MAVQFYLFPRALKTGEKPISMSAHIANTRIQTTIGISINPDYWFDDNGGQVILAKNKLMFSFYSNTPFNLRSELNVKQACKEYDYISLLIRYIQKFRSARP